MCVRHIRRAAATHQAFASAIPVDIIVADIVVDVFVANVVVVDVIVTDVITVSVVVFLVIGVTAGSALPSTSALPRASALPWVPWIESMNVSSVKGGVAEALDVDG